MAATIKIPTIFTAEDKFSKVMSKMTRSVRSFGRKGTAAINRFDTRVTKSFKKLGKLGQMALGIGIGAVFTLAIANNIAYEDSLASVSAITGAVGDDLVELERLSKNTGKSQRMLGKDVLKAYELIGSAKPELLENAALLDNVTNSAVTLAKAGRMELAPASEALTTTLNQFGLGGEKALSVIDNLAAGAKFGSSSITNTSDALAKFGTIAAATGTKVNEAIALVELVSPFEKGADAGTKLRNILGKLSGAKILPPEAQKYLRKYGVDVDLVTNKNISLSKRLKEMSKIAGDADAITKVFGETNKGLATGLFENIDGFDGMLDKINKTGVAEEQATINTNTYRFALDSIKTSFLNYTTASSSSSKSTQLLKDAMFAVADNIDKVIIVVASFIALFILMKAIVIANTIVTGAYNIALGINTALTQSNKRAIIGNTIATNAYKVAMAITTAVTWLANSAFITLAIAILAATWPILAIIAAITAIIYIFLYWNEIIAWFSMQWSRFTNFLGESWGNIVEWFTSFSFVDFFKEIGQSIINFMLIPLKSMLWLVSKMPGKVGKMGTDALEKINDLTGNLLVSSDDSDKKALPSTAQASSSNISESIRDSRIRLDVKDPGNYVEKITQSTDDGDILISLSNTIGAY